jgi:hypothetical protein
MGSGAPAPASSCQFIAPNFAFFPARRDPDSESHFVFHQHTCTRGPRQATETMIQLCLFWFGISTRTTTSTCTVTTYPPPLPCTGCFHAIPYLESRMGQEMFRTGKCLRFSRGSAYEYEYACISRTARVLFTLGLSTLTCRIPST